MSFELFDKTGRRKYLTPEEREAFLKAAEIAPRDVRTFCGVLAFTGCRISEALELTADRIDLNAEAIVFETLKKRRRGMYRAVPVPPRLLDALTLAHGLREIQTAKGNGRGVHLWPWGRATAWRRVKEVMCEAGVGEGPHASPKGLRHGFGIAAVSAGIPLNMVQRWLGHAQLTTTAIYAEAVGAEERNLAARMW